MSATVTTLVGATAADDVKVYTDQSTARPVVVQVQHGSGTSTLHLSIAAAGGLVDQLIEKLTERQSYAPF